MATGRTSVRGHIRKINGKKVVVRQHTRKVHLGEVATKLLNRPHRVKPGRLTLQPRRGGRNLKRAARNARQQRIVRAGVLGILGTTEIIGWTAMRGTALVLTSAVVLVGGLATIALSTSGGEREQTASTPARKALKTSKSTPAKKVAPSTPARPRKAPAEKATTRKAPAKRPTAPAKKTAAATKTPARKTTRRPAPVPPPNELDDWPTN